MLGAVLNNREEIASDRGTGIGRREWRDEQVNSLLLSSY